MAESTLPHHGAVDAFVERVDDADFDAVQRIYLFGSVARDDHRPNSDVDIFAVLDDGADVAAVEERLRDVAYDVTLERGAVFSIHALPESTLERRADHPFVRVVLDEGTVVYA